MIIDDDKVNLFSKVLMNAWYFLEEIHDDLNVLDLFPWLDLTIVSETVVEQKDGFRILGHHHHANLVLDELKIEFGSLKVFEVGLVPWQGE